jgi:hypothetical protein
MKAQVLIFGTGVSWPFFVGKTTIHYGSVKKFMKKSGHKFMIRNGKSNGWLELE